MFATFSVFFFSFFLNFFLLLLDLNSLICDEVKEEITKAPFFRLAALTSTPACFLTSCQWRFWTLFVQQRGAFSLIPSKGRPTVFSDPNPGRDQLGCCNTPLRELESRGRTARQTNAADTRARAHTRTQKHTFFTSPHPQPPGRQPAVCCPPHKRF